MALADGEPVHIDVRDSGHASRVRELFAGCVQPERLMLEPIPAGFATLQLRWPALAVSRSAQSGLLQRFGRLQVGIAGGSLLLVVTGFLDALLVLVNQLEPLLGDFLLRLV